MEELAAEPALTLLCGRYEGFDERIIQHFATDTLSIGRYVLAGGELAAMVVCDAVLRKLPGALGHADSAVEESFSAALGGDPEYPHYTRPAEYRGWRVPEVLLSGHHERIRHWRRERSRERGAGPPPPRGAAVSPGRRAAVEPVGGHGGRTGGRRRDRTRPRRRPGLLAALRAVGRAPLARAGGATADAVPTRRALRAATISDRAGGAVRSGRTSTARTPSPA